MTLKINGQQPSICLIIFPRPDIEGINIGVERILKILEPITREIFYITGNSVPDTTHISTIHLTKIKHSKNQKPLPARTLNRLLTELRLSYQFTKIARKVDVVAFMDCPAPLLPMLVGHLLRKKILFITVGSVADTARKQFSGKSLGATRATIASFLEELTYRLSSRIVVYSENIINQFGLSKHRDKLTITHHYFLVSDKFKLIKQFNKRNNVVGYIGRFSAEKGVLNFVKAISLVLQTSKDLTFLIGGDGELRNEIEELLKRENLNNKVKLTGWISPDILPEYLNELKLLVVPSYTETIPNIMMEAIACGTPVLITSVGLAPDVIKDSASGFILENNSPECIFRNVIRALNYPDLNNIAQNARSLIEKEYTIEAAVEAYREVLSNI